jgi:hypothetical protein
MTTPVVADPSQLTDKIYDPTGRHRPTYVLFGPGAEIISITGSIKDADVEAVLPIPYP